MKKRYFLIVGILLLLFVGGYFKFQKYQQPDNKGYLTDDSKEDINRKDSTLQLELKDESTKYENVTKTNNVIKIVQEFTAKTEELTSPIYELNIETISFSALSAYTKNLNPDSKLYYRIYDGHWLDWDILPRDSEVGNTDRDVFGMINIDGNIKKIQLKSNLQIEEVIFYIFLPETSIE